MKVKVIKKFKDKLTKALYDKDSELTMSRERFEEINSTALGIFVEEIREKKEPTKTKKK